MANVIANYNIFEPTQPLPGGQSNGVFTTYELRRTINVNVGETNVDILTYTFPQGTGVIVTIKFMVIYGGAQVYDGYIMIAYMNLGGTLTQVNQIFNQQYNPVPEIYALSIVPIPNGFTSYIYGPIGSHWSGTIEILKCP
jgi:hypothetical protein